MGSDLFKFECGDKVKDAVTGIVGIVSARMQCLNGCIRYSVEMLKKVEPFWVDEIQLRMVERGAFAVQVPVPQRAGPGHVPPSRDPKR